MKTKTIQKEKHVCMKHNASEAPEQQSKIYILMQRIKSIANDYCSNLALKECIFYMHVR